MATKRKVKYKEHINLQCLVRVGPDGLEMAIIAT